MTRRFFPLAFAVTALTAACNSDGSVGPARQDPMIGTWISSGSDVAIGLSTSMRVAMVTATFSANHTYRIDITDSTHAVTTYAGTWTAAGSNGVRAITLAQTSPAASIEEGVFQIDGARLTYEVVTTQPAVNGMTAPTVAAGFGSTAQEGVTRGSTWIQRFWNAELDMGSAPCNASDSLSVIDGKRPCAGNRWSADSEKGR
jgi:hypothetical protein